ncbi:Rubredoxin-type Fe(Cys)4 protein [Methanocorpusculum labreanum Z]|uniref:Rubredoxin n=1 Tax=Methanocorpusculum labreanum (strain ATCC 43576 / DSM 4855 / Z) TaxID=410358 RepID=A2SQ18_METLZ|nr:rubredoxin [Methanocorpusculum labreanum]ABN06424.1 Rubredoxin-type Fe(Cys)4 protein [Methanocorpusculum labreanum Z]
MAKWYCIYCGWIYDEEKGDPAHNVAPGTKYEDIPDSWKCPLCLIPKTKPGLFKMIVGDQRDETAEFSLKK